MRTTTTTGTATTPATRAPRTGTTVYSRDGARVGTIARVFRAGSTVTAAPARYAFLLEPGSAPATGGPRGPICLPASAIATTTQGRVTLALTKAQLAA
jgi:hypothetical protein